jgi:hypothetical protein
MGLLHTTDRELYDAFAINVQGVVLCMEREEDHFTVDVAYDIASRIAEQRHLIRQMTKRRPRLAQLMRKKSNRVRARFLGFSHTAKLNVDILVDCCAGRIRGSILGFLHKSHKKGDPLAKRFNKM